MGTGLAGEGVLPVNLFSGVRGGDATLVVSHWGSAVSPRREHLAVPGASQVFIHT